MALFMLTKKENHAPQAAYVNDRYKSIPVTKLAAMCKSGMFTHHPVVLASAKAAFPKGKGTVGAMEQPRIEPSEKSPAMDQTYYDAFGVDRVETIRAQQCAGSKFGYHLTEGSPPANFNFKDALSRKEYAMSGLCQQCQDEVFGPEEDD